MLMFRRRETAAIRCRVEAYVCVSLFALPGDRSSSRTELRVPKTVLSSLAPATSLPPMFYSAFSLGIPRSFDAHVSLERHVAKRIVHFALYASFFISTNRLYIVRKCLSRQDNYHKNFIIGTTGKIQVIFNEWMKIYSSWNMQAFCDFVPFLL